MEYIQDGKLVILNYIIKVGDAWIGKPEMTESIDLVKCPTKAFKFNPAGDDYKKGEFEALMAKTIKKIQEYGLSPRIIRTKQIIEFQEQEMWFENKDGALKFVKYEEEKKTEEQKKDEALLNAVRQWSDKMDVKGDDK